jgi:acyl dehydratase
MLSAVLDYGTKEMRFEGPVMPSDDIDADMKVIVSHYREAKGRYPDRFRLPD